MPVIDPQPAIIDMDTTYGAILLGLVCSAVLHGITVLQTFIYYRKYPKDPASVKVTVALLAILDTIHLIFCTITIYWYLITNYSTPNALGHQMWALNLQTDFNSVAGFMVQIFFARRVWRLSEKNVYLSGVIVLLSIIHLLGLVRAKYIPKIFCLTHLWVSVFTVEAFILVETSKFDRLIWVTVLGLGSAAGADILIAVSLCYYLMKKKTGFPQTDSIIISLVSYSLTTGLLSGIIALICVICFAIMPSNYIWLAFFWLLGKVYVNSLLASLNSRDHLREQFLSRDVRDGTMLQFALGRSDHRHSQQIALERRTEKAKDPTGVCSAVTVNVQTETKLDYI
ncbi:hypothetical protein CPB83DRAFT_421933 [Crepidotus variabilis]|uniref:DUF6534 domain-containing protein n=1 Tax=Crepidotus variabilis TaxID=179855 RepID=A0A9P6ESC9_9AGAR|nr:hypothetical protein CPB83DRAFT_421933 [Crepidotus variabilis]